MRSAISAMLGACLIAAIPVSAQPRASLPGAEAEAAVQPAHDLMLSTPGSPQEDAAVAQIAPALEGCVTQGQTVRFNRIALRSYRGESLQALGSRAATGCIASPERE